MRYIFRAHETSKRQKSLEQSEGKILGSKKKKKKEWGPYNKNYNNATLQYIYIYIYRIYVVLADVISGCGVDCSSAYAVIS